MDELYREFYEIINSQSRGVLRFRQKEIAKEKNHSLNGASPDAEISQTGAMGLFEVVSAHPIAIDPDCTATFSKLNLGHV